MGRTVWRRPARTPALHGADGAAEAGEDAGAPWGGRCGAGRRGRRRSMGPTVWRRPARTPALHGADGAAEAGEDAGAPWGRWCGAGRRGRRRSMGPTVWRRPARTPALPVISTVRRRPARTPALHGADGAAQAGEDAGAPWGRWCGAGRRGRRRSMGPMVRRRPRCREASSIDERTSPGRTKVMAACRERESFL